MSTLSITEVIDWLREKAIELNRTANSLEQIMGAHGLVSGIAAPPSLRMDVTAGDVVSVLRRKGAGRAYDVAKELKASKDHVGQVVKDNPDLFAVGPRGWIKIHENAHLNGGKL